MAARIISAQNSGILKCTLCSNTSADRNTELNLMIPYINGFTEDCNNNIKVVKNNIYDYIFLSISESILFTLFPKKKTLLYNDELSFDSSFLCRFSAIPQ